MYTVVILGTGNLAEHLCNAFSTLDEATIVQVYGRNPEKLKKFNTYSDTCTDPTQIKNADVYIIAVKDDAIVPVSKLLLDKKGIVAHTSGAIGMESIQPKNKGVFYPLQTFTKGKPIDFKTIPICIEAKERASLKILHDLAGLITDTVYKTTSEQREKLHLAAVFANNFTNYLYSVSEAICVKEGLPFSLLHPLIMETAEKLKSLSPREAQTGPARRGDQKSMEKHLSLLKNKKQTELYAQLSEAIKKMYEKEL